jgi:preprotein translocase subunit Sss1
MKTLSFKKVDTINGVTRTMTVKEAVRGYRKSEKAQGIVFFIRGKIGYIITVEKEEYTFEKYNYFNACYEHFEYDDIRKFFDFN